MNQTEALVLLKSSKSEAEWNANAAKVKAEFKSPPSQTGKTPPPTPDLATPALKEEVRAANGW